MKIRKATKKDVKNIADLFRREFRKPPYKEKWSEKDAVRKIRDYFKRSSIFVLETEKEITGFIVASTFLWESGIRGFIDEIVVSSKFQREGYGKKLINYAEDYFKKKGIKRVSLMSAKNSMAFKVYKKLGFKEENFVSMYKKLK